MSEDPPLRVLFVDDEASVLDALQRMLRSMRGAWDMAFVATPGEALERLQAAAYDVVVSALRLPATDGVEFLAQVMERHPSAVRILLTGGADQAQLLRSVGTIHQCLTKPCDPDQLKAVIAKVGALKALLTDGRLRQLAGRLTAIPSLPELYLRLVNLARKPATTLRQIGEVVARDPGMAARILQLVNSAFFGLRRDVSKVEDAVGLLGLETIQSLVLTTHVFAQLDGVLHSPLSAQELWSHSISVSVLAREIAASLGLSRVHIDQSFMAGILHDVGRVLLAVNLTAEYDQVMAVSELSGKSLQACEREAFGATHAELGGYMLGLWGISDAVTAAVAYHHEPQRCIEAAPSPTTAVHAANGLHHVIIEKRFSEQINAEYLARLGVSERVREWGATALALHQAGKLT
jgi:HD-like signal output (HDOD) protein/ActR/RegA family two-component response regulator